MNTLDRFDLSGKVAIITGGAGLMGVKHAEAVIDAGGCAVLWDINADTCRRRCGELSIGKNSCLPVCVDVTDADSIRKGLLEVLNTVGRIDILINNAAKDPKISQSQELSSERFEFLSKSIWEDDIAVGLTGVYLCCQIVGGHMADQRTGVILNIASDLGLIAPDQRIYRKVNLPENMQPIKPVTYSVIKHGIIGLTKYLATYWAEKNIRVNSISPGGIYNGQPDEFVSKLSNLIPMGRMADEDEYKAAVLFLISNASSYMTGSNLVIDGGRTCW